MNVRTCIAAVAVVAGTALAGCSSSPVVHQEVRRTLDGTILTTYAWLEHEHPDEGATLLLGAEFEPELRAAGDAALAEKGYRKDANPLFLVNWHVTVHGRLDTARMAEYYGYGPDWRKWAAATYPSAAMPVSSERNEEGTLDLDFLEAGSKELFWRGFFTGVIDPSVPLQDRRGRIDAAVRTVLAQIPPAK